jgi:hypothetical protein
VGSLRPSEQAVGPLVNRAFVDGLQAGMRTSGVVLAVAAFLALALLPGVRRSAAASKPPGRDLAFE